MGRIAAGAVANHRFRAPAEERDDDFRKGDGGSRAEIFAASRARMKFGKRFAIGCLSSERVRRRKPDTSH